MRRIARDQWVMEAPLYSGAGLLDSARRCSLDALTTVLGGGGEMARARVQAPQDLVAGASLLAACLFALRAPAPPGAGRPSAPGPGLLPRGVAILVGICGLWLAVLSRFRPGESFGRW